MQFVITAILKKKIEKREKDPTKEGKKSERTPAGEIDLFVINARVMRVIGEG